jgi:hypothetical protein
VKNFQADKCDPASASKAKELMGDVTVAKVKSVSAAAAAFVTWVCIQHRKVSWLKFYQSKLISAVLSCIYLWMHDQDLT